MKKILLIILIAGTSLIATAQSYTVSPSSTVSDTALCNQLNAFFIYQDNISGNTLNLGWNFISNTLPNDWVVSFCDNFNCYTWPGIPASGTMTPVSAGGQAFVILDVSAATAGSGTVTVYVYDLGNPNAGDTLSWNIASDCPTAIDEQSAMSNISVFPNPVTDYLNIKLADYSSPINQLTIYNSLGQAVYEKTTGSKYQRIDLSHYPAGIYMMVLKDETGKQTTKSFVK